MNGRVYDPEIGRFMSVDPVFQFPENTQSLNPYSYVLNNPLSLTDPTGQFAMVIPLAIAAYNLYTAANDVADAAVVLADDTASLEQKAIAVGTAASSVIDVTPGDLVKNSVKAMRQVAKGVDKAAAKEAGEKAAKTAHVPAKPSASNGAKSAQGAKSNAKGGESAPTQRDNASSAADSQAEVEQKTVSMDEAVQRGVDFTGPDANVRSIPTGVQMESASAADGSRRVARYDVNPEAQHVKDSGPHLNKETHVPNGRGGNTVVKEPDDHTPIDPSTVRQGDYLDDKVRR
jgi:hypothetical protein